MGDARRTQRQLPAANQRRLNGDGKEEIRFADVVVVKKVHDPGAEGIGIEHPAAIRNGDAELIFFIALAMQRNKSQCCWLGKLQQRTGGGDQRRRLVVVSVEAAQSPVETRNSEGRAEARTDCALGNAAAEARGTHSHRQRQPGRDLEFVVDEERDQAAGGMLADR